MFKTLLACIFCSFFILSEEILTAEERVVILHDLINRAGWKDVVIVYSYVEVACLLTAKLHNSGIKTRIVKEENINNFQWEFYHSKQGHILLSVNDTQLNWSIYILKNQLKLFGIRRKWICFSKKVIDFQFTQLLKLLSEGDRVVVLTEDVKNSNKCNTSTFSIFSLNFPGNGSYYFQCLTEHIFPSLFYNFHNRTLRIVSLGSFPIRQFPSGNNNRWSGYVFDIINILADSLNFSYIVEDEKEKIYGIEKNGTWNGMIGKLQSDKADIAAGDMSWSPERAEVVEFTFPIFPEYVTFVYKTPKSLSRAWILFETYSHQVWICIISTSFIVAGTIFVSLFINQKIRNQNSISIANIAGQALGYAFRTLIAKSCDTLPTFISVRLMIGTWWLVAVVFTAVHSGNLTSSLSFYKTDLPIDDLVQVAKKYPHFKFGIKEGSYVTLMNSSLFYDINASFFETIPANTTSDSAIELVLQKPFVWIAEKAILERKMKQISREEGICGIYVSKDYIRRSDWALALQKESVFLEQFNHRILQMHQFGLIGRLIKHYWDNFNTTCLPTDGINKREEHVVIRMSDIEAILLFLIIGEGFAIVVFFLELLFYNRKRKILCNMNIYHISDF